MKKCYFPNYAAALLVAIVCLLTAGQAQAQQTEAKISIQGVLKLSNGAAVGDGSYTLKFKLYDAESSGNKVYEQTIDAAVTGGVYSVVLDEFDTYTPAVAFDQNYFLTVTVGSEELLPRRPLTSAPTALSLIGSENKFPSAGGVGIGTTDPKSKLDVEGGVAVGANYSGTTVAPANGMIIQGAVGIGTNDPKSKLDVEGGIAVGAIYSGTTVAPANGMIIQGAVGIGTNNPGNGLLLDVNGYASITNELAAASLRVGNVLPDVYLGFWSGASQIPLTVNKSRVLTSSNFGFPDLSISAFFSGDILANNMLTQSDARIKNIISRSSGADDLQTVSQIQITDYSFVDKKKKGNRVNKKVIAQELEQVYPLAVAIMPGIVPDIYQTASIKAGRVSVANDLKAGEWVQLVFGDEEKVFQVLTADAQGFTIESAEEGPVFVFGRAVNDFRSVDYDALATLNISATQELLRMLKTEQELNKQQRLLHARQQEQIAQLQAQFDSLSSLVKGLVGQEASSKKALQTGADSEK